MTYKELMYDSLTNLLENGETLLHPIYGILNQGDSQFYGYFGFTEHYLLIALVASGKQITYTTRIPLDIKSVKVKQTAIFKQYVIDIAFNEGAPCRIIASPKVLMIDTQKNNLPSFLEYLNNLAPTLQQTELKNIIGEKIRRQYFNYLIGIFLSFVPMVPIMMFILEWKEHGAPHFAEVFFAFLETLPVTASIWGIVLIPLVILSLFNRFLFGKIVCVFDENGLYLDNDMFLWREVKSVSYKSASHSRFNYSPT